MLATIPLTLGAYVAAKLAADRLGLAPEWSWAAALVVYVATHRVVRGRWPLQPET